MLLDRDPGAGRDLASQPTLSRFENAIGVKELYRLGEALAASVLQRHAERLRGRVRRSPSIWIDDDPTHGAQQLSFFNRHYDSWCYLPVMGFVSFNDEAEQYLCAAVLRPGNVTAAAGAVGILRRLMQLIRHFLRERTFGFVSMAASRIPAAGVSGCRAGSRVCGGDGQKCGV